MPDTLRAAIADTHDEPTLRTWLKLAATHAADALAEVIRTYRAS